MALTTSTRRLGGVIVVDCHGRIILGEECTTLRHLVKDLLTQSRQIVLEFGEVAYIDSAGLGALVGLYTSARNAGGDIKLANLGPRLRDLLQLTRLYSAFEVFDTAEAAAAAFARSASA